MSCLLLFSAITVLFHIIKQVLFISFAAQMDLYREAQSKGLVGAEPLSRKRSLDMSQDEAYKQLRVRGVRTTTAGPLTRILHCG